MTTVERISLKDRDRQAVVTAASLLREQFAVERIILFGSKARGDDDAESDIDLLILTSGPVSREDKTRIRRALYALQYDLDVMISSLIVPLEEWEHGLYQVLPIHREVEEHGVIL